MKRSQEILVTETELIERVEFSAEMLGQKKLAEKLGISPQYLNDLLQRKRKLSDRVARKIGYRKVVLYSEI